MKAMNCPQCGAAVDVEEGQGTATCRFCLTKLAVPSGEQKRPAAKPGEKKPEPAGQLHPETKVIIWGLALLVVLVVIALSAGGAV